MLSFVVTPARADGIFDALPSARAQALVMSAAPEDRVHGVALLASRVPRSDAILALTSLAEHEAHRDVRIALARAFAELGYEAIGPLEVMRHSVDFLERRTAYEALASIGSNSALDTLVASIGQGPGSDDAIAALRRFRGAITPRLLRALGSPSITSEPMVRALGVLGDRRATPLLVSLLGASIGRLNIAAALALRDLGDSRAHVALRKSLHEGNDTELEVAVLAALQVVGTRDDAAAVAPLATSPFPEVRTAALRTLGAIAPVVATPLFEAAFNDPARREEAQNALLGCEGDAFLPLFEAHFADAPVSVAAALGASATNASIESLLRIVPQSGASLPYVMRAMAQAVRARNHDITTSLRARVHDALVLGRSQLDANEALELAAIVEDANAWDDTCAALQSPDARARRAAAHALEAFGRESARPLLREALIHETDLEAIRREASALALLHGNMPFDFFSNAVGDAATSPELLRLGTSSYENFSEDERRCWDDIVRKLTLHHDARTRAAAALAIGDLGAQRRWPMLVSLLSDIHPRVRLAAARALAKFEMTPELAQKLQRFLRTESAHDVYDALFDLGSSHGPTASRGKKMLAVVYELHGEDAPTVDIALPSGEWERFLPLPSGALFVLDLPSGMADVSVTALDEGH